MLPYNTEGLSKYQRSLCLKLLHRLPLPFHLIPIKEYARVDVRKMHWDTIV